jgi:hypothetical protein
LTGTIAIGLSVSNASRGSAFDADHREVGCQWIAGFPAQILTPAEQSYPLHRRRRESAPAAQSRLLRTALETAINLALVFVILYRCSNLPIRPPLS